MVGMLSVQLLTHIMLNIYVVCVVKRASLGAKNVLDIINYGADLLHQSGHPGPEDLLFAVGKVQTGHF